MSARLFFIAAAGALALSGCEGLQSALSGGSMEAGRIIVLSWIMFIGGGLILALVCGALFGAMFGPARLRKFLGSERLVVYGGIYFPAVVLSFLLFYGFIVLRSGAAARPDETAMTVSVIGERWWWRVIYEDENGDAFESANELRIPVGETVKLNLKSADVIHSFWVPAYAGKLDMIPGRTTTLHVKAEEPGLARGQCAEYCGGAHALMSFFVEAMPPDEFEAWRASEQAEAQSRDAEGARLFNAVGCGGCHAVRGTLATGVIGPDLTHVASRHSLAAATLNNDEEAFLRWLESHQAIKPGNRMPAFDFLSDRQRRALASYLASLE